MKVRKAAKTMTAAEWDNFVCAFKAVKEGLLKGVAKPTLDDFADEHAAAFKDKNHHWYVHSHDEEEPGRGHWGLRFFAWHRVFLDEFENRLRREVPGVTLPYWNAFKEPFPEALKKISDNEGDRVEVPTSFLPDFSQPDFEVFQHDLETRYHNLVHFELGRTMKRRHSPRDAGFWLHHAFCDRQWGHWSQKHDGAEPPSLESTIQGDEIVKGKKVKDVLHTTQLDYVYDNGVYSNVKRKGSDCATVTLANGMVLCARLDDTFHAKIHVYQLTDVAAFLTLQLFVHGRPGAKLGLLPPRTSECNLLTGKFDTAASEAHVRLTKQTSSGKATYTLQPVNGTRLAVFTGITDFTANQGEGATDYEMLNF